MARRIVLPEEVSGKTFCEWTVLSFGEKKSNQIYWTCRCSCGTVRQVAQNHLLSGKSTRCIKCSGKEYTLRARKNRKNPNGKYRYGHGLQEKYWGDVRQEQFNAQNGICPICANPLPDSSKCSWDHNHDTGECRELLHRGCNVFIWRIERDPATAQRTLDYLEKHRGK